MRVATHDLVEGGVKVRRGDARFPGPVHVVPKGSIRRHLRLTRKLRYVSPVENVDTRAQAVEEVRQTVPVFDVEAGRGELAGLLTRAALNERATRPPTR